jgi:flavorubredoxin
MRAVLVTEGIHWVGAVDWDLRDFHGFETPSGTTYNAYLAVGEEKVALVDTVKARFVPELLSRVESVVALDTIDYIVVNHIEPDHNGGLPQTMAACPNARVVASGSGAKGVAEYHGGLEIDTLGKDEVLDLGGLTLRSLAMPMVHWPDSMFTWCEERATLLPNDGFGQHLASSERFADEVGHDRVLREARTYFANILMPLGKQVGGAVEKITAAGWEPEIIAPSHGGIWRGKESVDAVLAAYGEWLSGDRRDTIVVAYSTMWESTAQMAHAIADGVAEEGFECCVYDIASSRLADITDSLLDAKALLLGSATLHHGMLYRVSGYLTYLEGLKPKGLLGGVFGSFGWSSGATQGMRERMEAIGIEVLDEEFVTRFRPSEDELEAARQWGRRAAKAARDRG